MKANNSLLRPGIISATDALLLSCSPVMAWKQDWKCSSNWGGWHRTIQNTSCFWSWTHFAYYSMWLRSSPEILSWSTMGIWSRLPPLPWDFFWLWADSCLFTQSTEHTVCVVFADAFLVGSGIFLEPDFKVVEGSCQVASWWFLLLQQFHPGPTGCPQVPRARASGDVLGFLYPLLFFFLMWELKGPYREKNL